MTKTMAYLRQAQRFGALGNMVSMKAMMQKAWDLPPAEAYKLLSEDGTRWE